MNKKNMLEVALQARADEIANISKKDYKKDGKSLIFRLSTLESFRPQGRKALA